MLAKFQVYPGLLSTPRRLALIVVWCLCPAVSAFAAPGGLDPTFDVDGKVVTPIGSGFDSAGDVAIQADGKIIVIVSNAADSSGYGAFVLVRYHPDGSV